MGKKLSQAEYIAKSKNKHGLDALNYDKLVYKSTRKDVTLTCNKPNHSDFTVNAKKHLEGLGCPTCKEETEQLNRDTNKQEMVRKANIIHNNKYTYNNFIYTRYNDKGWITCPIGDHGDFYMSPHTHLTGKSGCPDCAVISRTEKNRSNTAEFTEKAILIHGDAYDYSLVEYIDNHTDVALICKSHGVFYQQPNNHLQGKGCKDCAVEARSAAQRYNNSIFIEKAIAKHGDRYDYSKVIYVDSKTDVIMICKKHGEFEQTPSSHLSGSGCNDCAHEYVASLDRTYIIKPKYTNEEFERRARLVHGNRYGYEAVIYVNSNTKVIIWCNIADHGYFKQKPTDHLQGHNCPICADISRREKRRSNTKEFVGKAVYIHGPDYGYDEVEYVNNNTLVKIKCIKGGHGYFWQAPSNHLAGNGCYECGRVSLAKNQSYTTPIFIEKAIAKHGDRYDYSKVKYVNSKTDVIMICKKHGEFEQNPTTHLHGAGCPICSSSKGEKAVATYLDDHNIEYEREYTLPNPPFRHRYDFYLPVLNILIEFDGEMHYKAIEHFGGEDTLKEYQERDEAKDNLAESRNIQLIRIPYYEVDELEHILTQHIARRYKYNYKGTYTPDFLSLCKLAKLPGTTKPSDVKQYLTI